MLNYYWGENVSETALLLIIAKFSREELEDRVLNALTLTDLKNVAQVGGYTAVLGKLSIEKLGESKLPLLSRLPLMTTTTLLFSVAWMMNTSIWRIPFTERRKKN